MNWPKSLTRTPIGIDLGGRWIKAAQLARVPRKGAQLAAATAMQCADQQEGPTDEQIGRLLELLRRQGFSGRQVVLAAPRDAVRMDILSLPPRESGAPIEQIAHMEMARMHKFEPAAVRTDMWDLPQPARGGEGAHVMVAGCEHERAEALLGMFEQHGFDVIGLDCQAWAVLRACRPLLAPAPEITAILDVGWAAASLVVAHEQTLVYERMLNDGGTQHLHAALATHLKLEDHAVDHALSDLTLRDPAEDGDTSSPMLAELRGMVATHFVELAEQLQAAFAYVTHQYPQTRVSRLLLTGGGAAVCHLDEQFTETMGIEVRTVRPPDVVAVASASMLPEPQTALAGAIGLAQYDQ